MSTHSKLTSLWSAVLELINLMMFLSEFRFKPESVNYVKSVLECWVTETECNHL